MGQSLGQRHITELATLARLCGRPHNRRITINPRRYRDKETGQWLDGSSFKLTDLPALILALEAAHAYSAKTTLPGLPADDEELAPTDTSGEIPF